MWPGWDGWYSAGCGEQLIKFLVGLEAGRPWRTGGSGPNILVNAGLERWGECVFHFCLCVVWGMPVVAEGWHREWREKVEFEGLIDVVFALLIFDRYLFGDMTACLVLCHDAVQRVISSI